MTLMTDRRNFQSVSGIVKITSFAASMEAATVMLCSASLSNLHVAASFSCNLPYISSIACSLAGEVRLQGLYSSSGDPAAARSYVCRSARSKT